ncbi:UvrD-helicase domain-containing protein [bacterium]|nr:UvrD-helicase domain-containing protein [bacterium]
MQIEEILNSLNPEQKKAVLCTEGPLLVFAGAGSGKTKVITNRIAYLIAKKGVDPKNIMAVTFTKKAAGEMQERVSGILKDLDMENLGVPTIGTFHSIGAMILRQHPEALGLNRNFSIYDSNDTENLIKALMQERDIDIKQVRPSAISNLISSAKDKMVSPEQFPNYFAGFLEDITADIYPDYEKQLMAQNSVDFGDLLYLTVKLLEENEDILNSYQEKYNYFLIDEYQDTNNAQYRFAKLLSDKYKNICVVGDDDQGIYAWRGADIKNIQSFESDFDNVTVVKLEQNYRSTKNVISAAVSVIGQNNGRVQKVLWTDNDEGDKITVYQAADQEDEAEYIVDRIRVLRQQMVPLNNIAVLYRTNFQSRSIEEALLKSGMPYKLVGAFRFYDRKEIKDIISYLRFCFNIKEELSLDRVINVPSRKMGPKAVANIHEFAKQVDLSVGEFILGAFACLNMEEREHVGIQEGKIAQIQTLESQWKKYANVINLFGSIYTFSKGRELIEIIDAVLDKTDYIKSFDDSSEQAQMQKENIEELKNVAASYSKKYGKDSLEVFLNEINLIEQEQNKNQDETGNFINLMTLHSSKGLEFNYVFMMGMEEGLLPHNRALADENELEEERRLCYVGITRAKLKLYLTFAERRQTREGYTSQIPSRFLGEIPQDICEYYSYA